MTKKGSQSKERHFTHMSKKIHVQNLKELQNSMRKTEKLEQIFHILEMI